MKKSILSLILFVTLLSVNAFAQKNTTDTSKIKSSTEAKPQYQIDQSRVYHIVLDVTGEQIAALTGTSSGTISKSPKLSGEQISGIEDEAKYLCRIITSQASQQAESDYKKWQADTTAKYHPDTLKVSVKCKLKGK